MKQYDYAEAKVRHIAIREALIWLAGSKCKHCETTQNLQFDHKDPKTKKFLLSGSNLDRAWSKVYAEFLKCQLLCQSCHTKKTNTEQGSTATWQHGTLTGYKRCKCQECRSAKSKHNKEYRKSKPSRPKAPYKPKIRTPAPHGTYAGYKLESREGKGTCPDCREANRVYCKQLRLNITK